MKKLYFFSLLFLACQLQAQVNLTDSLYLYYKFDNNALDYSGKQHHGTNHNTAGTTDRCGNANSALNFNGTNNWVSVYPALPDMSSYTIHTWVYYNDTTKGWRGIFSDSDPTVYKDVFLNITDTLIEVIYDKTTNGAAGTAYSNKNFFNSWHQLVWVNTGTESRIYVDTVLVSTINIAGQNIGYHDTAYIGKMCDGNNSLRFFKGKLDEFRLYTRAINTAEIAALYNLSCEITDVAETEGDVKQVSLYPNPAGNLLFFEVAGMAPSQLQLFNTVGQQVAAYDNLKQNHADISRLPAGMYVACFTVGQAILKKQFLKW